MPRVKAGAHASPYKAGAAWSLTQWSRVNPTPGPAPPRATERGGRGGRACQKVSGPRPGRRAAAPHSRAPSHTSLHPRARARAQNHYTSPDKLAIEGRSAGGLLMGAVLNMRPDLFHAALAGEGRGRVRGSRGAAGWKGWWGGAGARSRKAGGAAGQQTVLRTLSLPPPTAGPYAPRPRPQACPSWTASPQCWMRASPSPRVRPGGGGRASGRGKGGGRRGEGMEGRMGEGGGIHLSRPEPGWQHAGPQPSSSPLASGPPAKARACCFAVHAARCPPPDLLPAAALRPPRPPSPHMQRPPQSSGRSGATLRSRSIMTT
jgi:hypothetical protein